MTRTALLALLAVACGSAGEDAPKTYPDSGITLDTTTDPATLEKFSFFVTSFAALQWLSGSADGFGGDLRYGDSGAGSGLRGADRICATIAEKSMKGASSKQWRAFLSATADETGAEVAAIDRIGAGPWFDRLGRLVASTPASIGSERPADAAAAIRNDLPNEEGVPNHAPDPTAGPVDNHHVLTGSTTAGRLYSSSATCNDWTSTSSFAGEPRVGLSWPRASGRCGGAANWISELDESGCGAGANLVDTGGPTFGSSTVGSGGGYGAIYCFALHP